MNPVKAAVEAYNNPGPTARCYGGCARIYVDGVGRSAKATLRKVAKALGRPYISDFGLYVGYDNGTKIEYTQGEAIAAALKAAGVDAYSYSNED